MVKMKKFINTKTSLSFMFQDSKKKSIETGVDRLFSIIQSKNIICLTDLAKELNVDKSTIEHWCEVLEEKGVIKIRYSLKDKYLMTPDYFKISNCKTAAIKDLISMNLDYLKLNKEEKEDFLTKKECEINEKVKELAKAVERLNEQNLNHEQKKKSVEQNEKKVKSKLEDLNKIEKLVVEREMLLNKKEKELDIRDKEINNKNNKVKLIQEKLFSEKKRLDIVQKKLNLQEKKIDEKNNKNIKKINEFLFLKEQCIKSKKEMKKAEIDLKKRKKEIEKAVNMMTKKEYQINKASETIKKRQKMLRELISKINKKESILISKKKKLEEYYKTLKRYESDFVQDRKKETTLSSKKQPFLGFFNL